MTQEAAFQPLLAAYTPPLRIENEGAAPLHFIPVHWLLFFYSLSRPGKRFFHYNRNGKKRQGKSVKNAFFSRCRLPTVLFCGHSHAGDFSGRWISQKGRKRKYFFQIVLDYWILLEYNHFAKDVSLRVKTQKWVIPMGE